LAQAFWLKGARAAAPAPRRRHSAMQRGVDAGAAAATSRAPPPPLLPEAHRLGRADALAAAADAADVGDAGGWCPAAAEAVAAPRPLWPAPRPREVLVVRYGSWAYFLVVFSVAIALGVASPQGELRHWLRERSSACWGQLVLLVGSVASCAWLLCTCHRDPGYLCAGAPVPLRPPPRDGTMEELPPAHEAAAAAETADESAPAVVRGEDSLDVPLHWCQYCHLLQPRRTRHCKDCRLCVRTFDHHCVWIGGCVGEFNHPQFVAMLGCYSAVLTWSMHLLFSCAVRTRNPFAWVAKNWKLLGIFALVSFPWVVVVVLFVYHAYLVATAQTTWEHLSRGKIDYLKPFPKSVCPFSAGGPCRNLAAFARRGRGRPPMKWQFTWHPGDPVPFNWFENEYWSCF